MADTNLKGSTIKKIQRRLGITQIELSQKLGVSYSYLQKLSYEHRPMTDSADKKIRERCGLDAAEIEELDKD